MKANLPKEKPERHIVINNNSVIKEQVPEVMTPELVKMDNEIQSLQFELKHRFPVKRIVELLNDQIEATDTMYLKGEEDKKVEVKNWAARDKALERVMRLRFLMENGMGDTLTNRGMQAKLYFNIIKPKENGVNP